MVNTDNQSKRSTEDKKSHSPQNRTVQSDTEDYLQGLVNFDLHNPSNMQQIQVLQRLIGNSATSHIVDRSRDERTIATLIPQFTAINRSMKSAPLNFMAVQRSDDDEKEEIHQLSVLSHMQQQGQVLTDEQKKELDKVPTQTDDEKNRDKTSRSLNVAGDLVDDAEGVSSVTDATTLKFSLEPQKLGVKVPKSEREAKGKYEKIKIGSETGRAAVGNTSSAIGAASGALGGISGVIGFAKGYQAFKNPDASKEDKANAIIDMAEGGGKTVLGGLSAATNTASAAKGFKSMAVEDKDTASNLSDQATALTGAADALGALGSVLDVVISTGRATVSVVTGIAEMVKGEGVVKTLKKRGDGIAKDMLTGLKAFLSAGKSAISAARFFVQVFGGSADFLNVVPVLGAALNITIQLIDMLVQLIKTVVEGIKIAKAWISFTNMEQQSNNLKYPNKTENKSERDLLQKLKDINEKRVYRHLIPFTANITRMFADVVSITGSVLNIVGVATSPAYGAGVGLMAAGYASTAFSALTKIGASATESSFKAVRFIKQKGRDKAAEGKWGAMDKVFKFDQKKTTAQKQEGYRNDVVSLFKVTEKLDVVANPLNLKTDTKAQYKNVLDIIKATGVDKKELFKKNGDPIEQAKMLIVALKGR